MRSMLMTNPALAAARLGQDPFEMTTQAAGAVFPFVMQQGLRDLRGVVVGMNVLAGGAFVFDPFRAYANGLVTNPNMAIFGSPGQGKSALVKTLLSRMDALSGASRFVAIIDPNVMFGVGVSAALGPVADEAAVRLRRVLAALATH